MGQWVYHVPASGALYFWYVNVWYISFSIDIRWYKISHIGSFIRQRCLLRIKHLYGPLTTFYTKDGGRILSEYNYMHIVKMLKAKYGTTFG